MVIDSIFIEGWWKIVLLYAGVFLLVEHIAYKIIFQSFIGQPRSWSHQDIRFWRRKATFINAVFVAPLFEEYIITYLAYASFLDLAKPGKEGIVVLLVALLFALLHLPGDIRRQQNSYLGIRPFDLIIAQFLRFFYSLTAYFIYLKTGTLWASIVLHYLANALVSFYNFDLEDGVRAVGSIDILGLLIMLMQIGFGFFATYQFYFYDPIWGIYLIGIATMYVLSLYIK